MLFKELVNSLIPDEIKAKTVLYDTIQILLEYIEDNNNFSYDISKIFTADNPIIKDAMVTAYLENLKSAYEKALLDDNISQRLIESYEQVGLEYTPSVISNISTVLNEEYIYTAKEFKQKKGTIPAIEYAYNAIRGTGIQSINVNTDLQDRTFKVIEGTQTNPNEPFIFQVEGSLFKEVYENAVKPIVHPVGFGYFYSKLSTIYFDEFVNVKVTYPNAIVQVVCSVGGTTLDFSNFTVTNIIEEKDEFQHKRITVIFDNNTKLVREFDTTVSLQDLDGNILQDFPDYCALYLEYTPTITSTITDNWYLTELEQYEEEYIGYIPGVKKTIGNFIVGDLNIGGLIYIGFITEDFNEILEQYDVYNQYFSLSYIPSKIGSVVVGDKYSWGIGTSTISTLVEGEVYSTSVEVDEVFSIETIIV